MDADAESESDSPYTDSELDDSSTDITGNTPTIMRNL